MIFLQMFQNNLQITDIKLLKSNKQTCSQPKGIKYIYLVLLINNLLNNFDTGVIFCSVIQIQKQLQINQIQIALFGSFAYIGAAIGLLILPYFIKKFSIKKLIITYILLNAFTSIALGFSYNLYLIYLVRLVMGLTQTLASLYGTIWVNSNGPKKWITTWMGLLLGFITVGVVVGYGVAALLINNWSYIGSWRVGFFIQGGLQLILIVMALFMNEQGIKIKKKQNQQQNLENSESCIRIFKNSTFILNVLGLSCIILSVIGIEYWATQIFVKLLGIQEKTAMLIFTIDIFTAPLMGMVIGGFTMDLFGGYKGDNCKLACKIILVVSSIIGLIGLLISITQIFLMVQILTWLFIFFINAIIPVLNGVCLTLVDIDLHAFASCVLNISINMGYFLGPVVFGLGGDYIDGEMQGLKFMFKLNCVPCFLSILFFGLGYFFLVNKKVNPQQ